MKSWARHNDTQYETQPIQTIDPSLCSNRYKDDSAALKKYVLLPCTAHLQTNYSNSFVLCTKGISYYKWMEWYSRYYKYHAISCLFPIQLNNILICSYWLCRESVLCEACFFVVGGCFLFSRLKTLLLFYISHYLCLNSLHFFVGNIERHPLHTRNAGSL